MAERVDWGRDDVQTELKKRKFLRMCPPMEAYLYPGAKVLDVGCGPGSITRDIAAIVHPGCVVGIDREPKAIEQAENIVNAEHIPNLTFQVGDADHLDFATSSFDVVLSLNLSTWLRDPVRALQEQRRVTREGGWVLTLMYDFGNIIFYPACPSVDKFIAMLSHLKDTPDKEVFTDSHQGRRAIELMSRAGFKEIKIEPFGVAIYRGTDDFDWPFESWTRWLNLESPVGSFPRKLMELGLIDEQMLSTGRREIAAWHAHPHALYLQMALQAAGRVT